MDTFAQGVPYTPGGQTASGVAGSPSAAALPVQRLVTNGAALTRTSDSTAGQAAAFGPFKGRYELVRAMVLGPLGSRAFVYVGTGDLDDVVIPGNQVDYTPAGFNDIASYGFSPIPIFDSWQVVIFWDRPLSWGMSTAQVYVREVGE